MKRGISAEEEEKMTPDIQGIERSIELYPTPKRSIIAVSISIAPEAGKVCYNRLTLPERR